MVKLTKLLESVAVLLWPLIAIVILYLFRPAVATIIESAKSRKFSVKMFGQELTMEQAFGEVESRVRVLQMLIKGSVTDFEYEKLKGLATEGPFRVRFHWDMYHELRRLASISTLLSLPNTLLFAPQGADWVPISISI